ncbi:MAG: Aldo/keto reductase [Candidatus Amesbacteria bacterium GW2011_GWB1_47_19]|nr:MAG: Aldo/keto reductase [Candidatus Amesbacteria bacterium GW2011_GWA1_44_24]KKU32076.1 MAG: Aldo/keto reductase [Candidatus Amesbacteria bacterium GW2011_GWC1_46_24]KKU67760.1 MAG: Aldo/keto reductase [Candidatus Amesbacteria bacterium GW2011_GWB1_47_19]OGD06054.1 MAG: aldo/keto reductase [Candidatus Amesbacteria bacterium RIFOXYB1_FULL_47_13]HBC72356.1 aldo/keto reductase [Candidatus Amesbacteria bacterium]
MKYRTLGKTGLKVAEIGIGTWQLAGDPNYWVDSNLNESLKSLHRYTELGGNFIDTAWIYGYDEKDGRRRSHELIGKFLKESGQRNKLIIASKVPPKNMHWPAQPEVPISEVFPDNWIIKCVDDSLKDLGIDHLDLMQFHVWQDSFVKEDGWKNIIRKLTRDGKVSYWGISVNDYQPENCLKALDTGLISAVQFIFNIFHQKPAERLLPYAQSNNIGLIARVPLDEGGLTGKFDTQTRFATGDFRQQYFNPERLRELVIRTDALKKLLGNEAGGLVDLALRYLLSFKEVSTIIPGMRKVSYVDANTSASDAERLPARLLEELKSQTWERNFYS